MHSSHDLCLFPPNRMIAAL